MTLYRTIIPSSKKVSSGPSYDVKKSVRTDLELGVLGRSDRRKVYRRFLYRTQIVELG